MYLRKQLFFAVLIATQLACVAKQRNVVLITLDTTRADHIGCYGYQYDTSPRIDQLAEEGVRFDFAIAQSSETPISCASQLTGTYPYRHKLRAMHGFSMTSLDDSVPTLAEVFSRHEYVTAAFISAFPASSRYGLERGFAIFDESFLRQHPPSIHEDGTVATGRSQRSADETTSAVLEWLQADPGAPFFLWVHLFDPHDTHVLPPAGYLEKRMKGRQVEDQHDYLRAVYDAEISYADMHVGIIIDELDRLGLRESTVLAVTSDHGEGLGDHNWWKHSLLYQEQIQVPLILQGPGIPAGQVITPVVEHVDLMPTLLQLAKIDHSTPAGVQGQSLIGLLLGDVTLDRRTTAYSEVHSFFTLSESPGKRDIGVIYSIIDDRWKLLHFPRRPAYDKLFDLQEDPGELRNLIDQHPEIFESLFDELARREAVDTQLPEPGEITAEDLEFLKSLGYVE
jgi:arylsulfatase A-like enzyme